MPSRDRKRRELKRITASGNQRNNEMRKENGVIQIFTNF